MKTTYSRLGLILSGSYFFLFSLSAIFFMLGAGSSAFASIYMIVFTLPWSLILVPAEHVSRYIAWYDSLLPSIFYYVFALLPFAPLALINGAILYSLGKALESKPKKS